MAARPRYPSLYQINTRVWLRDLSRRLAHPATLDDVPDAELDRIASLGFDWVWFLGVWRTGEAGRTVSHERPQWRAKFADVLPDLTDDDICGSCFAITGYEGHPAMGGDEALRRLRERLKARGLKLMLDFVPNHMALDHPWVQAHPDWFVQGLAEDLARTPDNWCRLAGPEGGGVFAYGRDPYFPGWPDTLQLNYGSAELQAAMRGELLRIAGLCDGVRCDMAMLLLPEVFRRTWGIVMEPFWSDAIAAVRRAHPAFTFMAEVYWDLEWALQQLGFGYTYDKRLYDRLREGHPRRIRDHLVAGLDFQDKLARFLENHDEARAAATFPREMHEAAAIVTYLAPGLRFFQQGQMEGRRVRIPTHLCRAPDEPIDEDLAAFYARLLDVLRSPTLRNGTWTRLEPLAAWTGNETWDRFIAYVWQGDVNMRLLAVINYASAEGQCYLRLPVADMRGRQVRLRDLMSAANYQRDGAALISPGLYLEMSPWQYHVFALEEAT